MPDRFFQRDVADRPVTFATVRELAEVYRTSLMETARRLVSRSPFPAMLIYNGPPPKYERWHERGPGIPGGVWPQWFPGERTVAHELRNGPRDASSPLHPSGVAPGPVLVRADEWIIYAGSHQWQVVCEDSVLIGEQEVLTLLWWRDDSVLRAIAYRDDPEVRAENDRRLQEMFRRRVGKHW